MDAVEFDKIKKNHLEKFGEINIEAKSDFSASFYGPLYDEE